jgi:acetyl-CoA carboxylase biotin carboxyl carrier protein
VSGVASEPRQIARAAGAARPRNGGTLVSEPVDPGSRQELRALLSVIEEAGWEYARIEIDGVTLTVSSDPDFVAIDRPSAPAPVAPAPTPAPAASSAAPAPAPLVTATSPEAPAAATSGPSESAHTVTAPTIGLFWRSPKPGAPPFVEVGDRVEAGDTVCIIEVMKLMTHVPAGVTGVVQSIHVSNGEMVEHGTPLLDVEPEATS